MTKRLLSFVFALFGFSFLLYADCADCEAYKTQVVNDCDSLHSLIQSSLSDNSNISIVAQNGANATLGSTQGNDQLSNLYFNSIVASSASLRSTLNSLDTFVSSIRSTAQSLQCNASSNTVGSCDCAQYLQSLISLLTTCNQTLAGVSSGLNAVRTSIGDIDPSNEATIVDNLRSIEDSNSNLLELLKYFFEFDLQHQSTSYRLSDFYNLIGSFAAAVTNARSSATVVSPVRGRYLITSNPKPRIYGLDRWNQLRNEDYEMYDLSLYELLFSGIADNLFSLASLNNYSATNLTEFSLSRKYLHSINTNVASLSSKFSIFNDFVLSGDAPLSMYTDKQTDGSYHDYLTNYYIKVSKGQQSGSDNYTNWFSRVELLLAALVFRDEDDSTINTNGVPSESDKNSVTEVGSSLGQTISGFVQDGNSHVSSVDTSGKSIIRMVTSWNTAIGQTAKPAPFVVAEFATPDSQSRSNISLYFDTEDEKLSSLIEIGHGISTLAWVSVFLLLGYNLAVYSIRVLRRLISFSFSLYSAIFGGG